MEVKDIIKKNRPNLSEGSLKTYNSIINNLMKKNGIKDIKEFKDYDAIIEKLSERGAIRKTQIASIIVLLDDDSEEEKPYIEKYRKVMMEDSKKYREEEMKQEKTDTQEKNWMDFEEIKETYEKVEKANKFLWKQEDLNNKDFQRLQDSVILALMSGVFIPPRRLLDYTDFKLRDINKETDNYIEKDQLVFNKYKTASKYKTQKVDIPTPLKKILTMWKKVNPHDYLFVDSKGKPLSSALLNQKLAKIFGKPVSVNIIRHSYLTHKLGHIPDMSFLEKLSAEMGHSIQEQLMYIKKD